MKRLALLVLFCACAPSLRPVRHDAGADAGDGEGEFDAGPQVKTYITQTAVDGGTFAYVDAQTS